MDFDQSDELDEHLRRAEESSDALALAFLRCRYTLVIDFRCSAVDGPMVRVMPMVRDSAERRQIVAALRPRLGPPATLTLIPWSRAVANAKEEGLWQAIAERVGAAGCTAARVRLERAYRELLALERAEARRAIAGEGYETVWERSAAR